MLKELLLKNYKRMLQYDEELREAHTQNPMGVVPFFLAFYLSHPLEGQDPFVAAHLVRQIRQDPKRAGGYLIIDRQHPFASYALWRAIHPSWEALEQALLTM